MKPWDSRHKKLYKPACRWVASGFFLFALLAAFAPQAFADPDQAVRTLEQQTQQQARAIQQQVEALDQTRQADFQAWQQIRRETLLLQAHNQRLADWNKKLQAQIHRLQRQLNSLDTTRHALAPLMQAMVERLAAFIRHDLPFEQAQRLERVAELQKLLQRVDVSQAEKLRQLLATYRNEVNQGRQLSQSTAFIRLPSGKEQRVQPEQRVQLLRVGRIGLYYLSADGQQAGVWQAAKNRWQPLSAAERGTLAKGLALAQEQGLPELLRLPLSVPLRAATDGEVP